MVEDLTDYLKNLNLKVTYIHLGIDTIERAEIIRDLQLGVYDVLAGIDLLWESLDLSKVNLVVILDAGKEGFLWPETNLAQTAGRVARNVRDQVIMYVDKITNFA